MYSRQKIRSWTHSQLPIIWEKRLGIIMLAIALILGYIFKGLVEAMVFMVFFIVLGIASLMYNRWIKFSIGVELIMLGMVLCGLRYGTLSALIVGAVALFFAEILTDRFTYSTFISFIGIIAVSVATPHLSDLNVTWVGIWMTLLYDLIIGPGYLMLGSSPWRTGVFLSTHIAFNLWVFIVFAPTLYRIIS